MNLFSTLNALAEAVVVDVEQLSFSPEKRLLDKNYLFEICTCLITLTSKEEVRLAHYSVKEYLFSERIQRSPTASFQISEIGCGVLAKKICLVYLLDITYDGVCSAKDYLSKFTKDQRYDYNHQLAANFPFLTTALCWDLNDIGTISDLAIDGLLIRLFNPKEVHYQHCTNIRLIEILKGIRYPSWRTLPGAEPIVAFANACRHHLVGTAKAMLESKPDLVTSGDLLEFDPDNGYRDVYILRAGTLLDLLDVAIYFLDWGIINLLLDWGANPNANGPDRCCGVDVNALGDDGAIVRAIERRSTTDVDGKKGHMKKRYLSQNEIQQSIHARSSLRNYDTPLRIVETRLRQADGTSHKDGKKRDKLLAM